VIKMTYNALKELMSYYYLEFNVYYLLGAIMLINTIKFGKDYISIKKNKTDKIQSFKAGYFDLIISVLIMLGLGSGFLFQGALSDISSEYSQMWISKMIIIAVISFVLFIVQLVLYLFIKRGKIHG